MIWLILLVAFIFRLINLNQSLWLDESINVLASRDLGFWHFVSGYSIGDFHPPGYFAILWIWSHLFGYSEISVRMPSVFFGVGTVFLTYLIGRQLFNKSIGLVAAVLLAVAPLHIYYSQEARMYSMAAFAVALSFYGLAKLLDGQKKYLPIYIIGVVLSLYSDYLPYLALFCQFLYLIIFKRKFFKTVFSGMLIGVFTLVPWLFIFPEQLKNGQQTAINVPGWAKVVGGSNLKNVALVFVKTLIGRIGFDNKILYAGIVIPIAWLHGFLMYKAVRKINDKIWLLLFWVFMPVLVAFLVSFFIPVLFYFRMLYILPGFYLLVAVGLGLINPKWVKVILKLLLLISLISVSFYYFNPKFQREDWKGLANFLSQKADGKSIAIFENDNLPAPYRYYDQKKLLTEGGIANFPANSESDIKQLDLSNLNTVYLVDYLVEISDPGRLVDKKLTSSGWVVKNVYNFQGVGLVYEYRNRLNTKHEIRNSKQ